MYNVYIVYFMRVLNCLYNVCLYVCMYQGSAEMLLDIFTVSWVFF